jgi:large subunit ribosomal protein L1
MGRRSKKYNKQAEALAKGPVELPEAVKQLKSIASAGFDQSIECVLQLGIDPKQAEQQIRGAVSLPHGIGKQKRVVAFCEESDAQTARQAGAIEAGCDELIKKIQDGWMDFDVAIASPKVMGKVGKLGRTLGPQGKMPTPKNGTVTPNVAAAVSEFAAGKVEFRNDGGGNVHAVVGKQSFEEAKLIGNIEAFITHIKRIRPATAKGSYIKNVYISATMSPSVQISI